MGQTGRISVGWNNENISCFPLRHVKILNELLITVKENLKTCFSSNMYIFSLIGLNNLFWTQENRKKTWKYIELKTSFCEYIYVYLKVIISVSKHQNKFGMHSNLIELRCSLLNYKFNSWCCRRTLKRKPTDFDQNYETRKIRFQLYRR